MISLRDLQRDFLGCALGDTAVGARPWVVANGLSADQRLRIYRNNAAVGFEKAMQATFPALVRLGGLDWFNQMARAYQRVNPSRSGDLNDVGGEFAAFLSVQLKGGDYEYFGDVALLEWTYQECLGESAVSPDNLERLALHLQGDLSQLRFRVAATTRAIESIYPLFEIWNQNRSERAESAVIDLRRGASRVLVIRRIDHVEVREVSAPVFRLLQAFAAGSTMLEAAAVITETQRDADFSDVLTRLFGLGVLVGFQLTAIGE
jgi:hypothetical protein